jgi:hypothetical protein
MGAQGRNGTEGGHGDLVLPQYARQQGSAVHVLLPLARLEQSGLPSTGRARAGNVRRLRGGCVLASSASASASAGSSVDSGNWQTHQRHRTSTMVALIGALSLPVLQRTCYRQRKSSEPGPGRCTRAGMAMKKVLKSIPTIPGNLCQLMPHYTACRATCQAN